jgi:hypothetical protein
METKGLEPSTSALRTHEARVPSVALPRVTTPPLGVSAVVSPKSREPGQGTIDDDQSWSGAEVTDSNTGEADFSTAVTAIMRLPLSDAEKAEAVRRLLAGR